jgi:type II secretory pathway component PulM
MNGYWNNLRPLEKRMVVGFGAGFFVILNLLFVFPHFSDLDTMYQRRAEAEAKLTKFRAEINQTNLYVRGIREMQKENEDVAPEDQSYQFQNAVSLQAAQSHVTLQNIAPVKTTTNQFFLEKSQNVQVQAGEDQLVDFLYNLGAGNSQVRVRDLTLRPDAARQHLVGGVTLVASYQKRVPTKGTAPAVTPGLRRPPPRVANAPSVTGPTPAGRLNTANNK